ncbi:MAG TPA: prepilin-type N-terminal cleavage/methylation domain-containing protein [Holophagaceae bacterium]|jgi:prepilin-type N-terminal cleavage/methylation domain-containing protein|nr:prepilin-type N-terminal cleavage/methylation domain-containing protein [Holophagaceae bacterium]
MNIRKMSNAHSGFSLVEFLMVAIILGVGLLGLAALTTMSTRGFGGSRVRNTAASLGGSVLDRLALDGRLSAAVRTNGGAIPASALVANAVNDAVNAYADPATTFTTFDLQGQGTNTTPIYTVTWVRRSSKTGIAPAATSLSVSAEVVVNVAWNEAVKNAAGATTTVPRYLSVSRSVRY